MLPPFQMCFVPWTEKKIYCVVSSFFLSSLKSVDSKCAVLESNVLNSDVRMNLRLRLKSKSVCATVCVVPNWSKPLSSMHTRLLLGIQLSSVWLLRKIFFGILFHSHTAHNLDSHTIHKMLASHVKRYISLSAPQNIHFWRLGHNISDILKRLNVYIHMRYM